MDDLVPLPASAAQADESAAAWLSANAAVLRLGLDWIAGRLLGQEAGAERAAYRAARAAMAEAGDGCALDRIGACFGLAPFDEDALLVALAPAVDGSLGPRYAALAGRPDATPHLLARLLFTADMLPVEAMLRLARDAPLRRWRLLETEEPGGLAAAQSLLLPERMRELLCGFGRRDRALDGLVRVLPPVPLPARLQALAEQYARGAAPPGRLQIIGPKRSGRQALASGILALRGLDALAATAGPGLVGVAAILARDALIEGGGVVLEMDATGEAAAARALDRALDGPLLIVAEAPVEGLEAVPVLRLEPLDATERAELWQRAAGRIDPHGLPDVAEQFALGPGEIDAIASQPGLAERGAWAACRDLGARDLEALATRIVPERGWDDIVLAEETLAELRALAAQVAGRAQVHGDWGYRRLLGRATGISALFAGPSGVGKTMAAEVIAREVSLDLYVVDLARVTSKYIGETEKNLRRIFDAAEAGGCVLFFDEADALFGKRSEVKDSHDRYANAEVSYLLHRMERYGGLAILATNLKAHLDTAFLRRLRMVVDFPMPDVAARLALWRRALPATAPRQEINWTRLARLDLSGGNIATVAANAAFRAAAEGQPIGMCHLQAAIAAEFRKLDRDPAGLEAGR